MKTPNRKAITKTASNGNITSVVVQEPDPYTGMSVLEIQTQVFDHYNNTFLDMRKHQLFMSADDIRAIGRFLADS